MHYTTINVKNIDSIAHVTLNRPDVRNAMNVTMIKEITQLFSDLNNDPSVRGILLSGNGKSFCAGVDLEDMRKIGQMDWDQNVQAGADLENMYTAVDHCSKPVIGKIHGHAFGGGFGLCTVCDIVLAEKNTAFCLSEVLIGIVPAVIGPFTMNKIGQSYFRALGISGEKFDGDFAEKIGLTQYSVSEKELGPLTQSILHQIMKASPQAIAKFKEYCRNMDTTNSAKLIAELRASEEGQEGLSAYLEKRAPSWAN